MNRTDIISIADTLSNFGFTRSHSVYNATGSTLVMVGREAEIKIVYKDQRIHVEIKTKTNKGMRIDAVRAPRLSELMSLSFKKLNDLGLVQASELAA